MYAFPDFYHYYVVGAQARDLVRRSSGVERTRDLARAHADKARDVVRLLPESEARHALEVLTERVVKRTW